MIYQQQIATALNTFTLHWNCLAVYKNWFMIKQLLNKVVKSMIGIVYIYPPRQNETTKYNIYCTHNDITNVKINLFTNNAICL